jgi:tetratricopeptide (TPR) repeat protein
MRKNRRAKQTRATRRKIGRNAPCPCGSKKKFKHCHGKPEPRRPSAVTIGTVAFDARDYAHGVKRRAKDFRRVLFKTLDIANFETTKYFDESYRTDISAIHRHLAHGYEVANSIGLDRSPDKPLTIEQSFFLFHEALNLVLTALRTIRGGSIIAGDSILRQALELACVGYQIVTDDSGEFLNKLIAGKLHAPKSVSIAKRVYEPIGRWYGALSNSAVHASVAHIYHSISSQPDTGVGARIRIGASFDPGQGGRFKLGLIRIERVSLAIVALIEAGFFHFLETPLLVKKVGAEVVWSCNPKLENRLKQLAETEQSIENPYATVYPWADPKDREEIERLLGTIKGEPLQDLNRLRPLSQANPKSFTIHYLLGSAFEEVNDLVSAASAYEVAWQLRPNGYDVWSRLEGIYKTLGQERLREDFYRRSIELDPKDYVARHNLGMLYSAEGRFEEALECFQQAHLLRPERYQPVFNGAKALLHLGRYVEAVDWYHHASEREPENPDPWHSAGVAYVRGNDLRKAYASFRRAVWIDSGYIASWANLAIVCRELGMVKRALRCANRALGLAPGDQRVREIFRECESAARQMH